MCHRLCRTGFTLLLFDDFTRHNGSPAEHAQGSYDFLNKSAWRVCSRARDLCQSWFDRYPAGDQSDLGARFRSKDNVQHVGAYFELVLHELLLCLGFEVTPHPSVPDVPKRPAFLAESERGGFYLEATVSFEASTGKPESPIIRSVYDWIDQIPNPYYRATIEIDGVPKTQPSKRSIVDPIAQLMDDSDPERDRALLDAGKNWLRPEKEILLDGCSLLVRLTAKPRSEWGVDSERTIGVFPGGSVRDIAPVIRDAVTEKAKHKRASRLDRPLVIACSTRRRVLHLRTRFSGLTVRPARGRLSPSRLGLAP